MENLKKYLSKELNISKNEVLTLSVSGGVDSMVMLDVMNTFGYKLLVVNFDHQKRSESALDAKLVSDYCKLKNIPFVCEKLNISGTNFQEKASTLRKEKLEKIALNNNSKYIFTAHHADDLLETILMKISRGSNLYGYAGMQKHITSNGFHYIKPLLHISKDEIIEYSKSRNIAYLEDNTNSDDVYTRNRYRHHIIPQMKIENPVVLDKIISFSNQLASAFYAIRKQSSNFLKDAKKVNITEFNNLDLPVKLDCLAIILEMYNIAPTEIQLNKLLSLVENKKPNIAYSINKNYFFVKSYNSFSVEEKPVKHEIDIKIVFGHKIDINDASFTFFDKPSEFSHECDIICYNKLAFPLRLRSRKDGDILELTYGHKKLKDFLIDKKVPKSKRDNLCLLVDSNDVILWIPNLYANKNIGNENEIYIMMEASNA